MPIESMKPIMAEWPSEQWTYEIVGANVYRLTSGDRRSFLESHRGHIQWLIGDLFWIDPVEVERRRGTYVVVKDAA